MDRLVSALASQPGVSVRRTGRQGWLFYLPDGSTATLHSTQSDRRAMHNFRAIITKAGLEWPGRKRA
jgi:hypothetical protein